MDTFSAQLPTGLASPAKPPLPPPTATSSQRSAGTVSGGEVAQPAALAPAGSLKRTLSSCAEGGDCADSDTSSQGWSKSARGSVEATPARRAARAARAAWAAADSGDEAADSAAGSGDDGLEFLLRACEMLDPHLEVARWVLLGAAGCCWVLLAGCWLGPLLPLRAGHVLCVCSAALCSACCGSRRGGGRGRK